MSLWRTILAGWIVVGIALRACPGDAAEGPGPLSPAASKACFEVVPGHAVELVAAEPLVFDPVAICFGPDGRLYVAEMSDYPNGDGGGRIVTLTDTDGDGMMDTRTLFAAGLPFPNGLLPWRDGLLVTAAPDILLCTDSDGDGAADQREVVLTGFNAGNQQLRVNGLSPGPDGWVYAANGRSGGMIRSPKRPDAAAVSIDRHDLRFRPDSGEVEAVAGFSQFGMAFDAEGNRFSNWNTAPVRHVVFPLDVAARHPFSAPPTDMEVLEDPLQQNRLFPVSAAPTTFNREPTDAFNASCGLSIDRGSLLTPSGCAYVCEPLLNIVHRRQLVPSGATFEARRPPGEESREFLASRDPWFRPVFTAIGPDGCLWICDFYRRWVEHPDFVKAELRAGVDWDEGKDRGRIWRVRPVDDPARARGDVVTVDAVASQGLSRGTARRRLQEAGSTLATVAATLASHPDPAVRFEVALAVETLDPVARAAILTTVVSTAPADRWVDSAVICVAAEAAPAIVGSLAKQRSVDRSHGDVMRRLAEECGRSATPEAPSALSEIVASADLDGPVALSLFAGWVRGVRSGGGKDLPDSFGGTSLDQWLELARALAVESAGDSQQDALELLALDASAEATGILVTRLVAAASVEVATTILRALRGRDPVIVGEGIVAAWPAASPAVRRAMLAAFFHPDGLDGRLSLFVQALDRGAISPGDIDPDTRQTMLTSDALSADDRARLQSLLGGAASADRTAVVAAVEGALPPAGDREQGRSLFTKHCAGCHRSGGLGARVGPDLTAMHTKPRGQVLEDILDPNRRLTGEYAAVVVVTTGGEAFTGLVSGETPTAVQLSLAEGKVETIPRGAIEVLRGTGKSLMPEGFEQTLRPEEFADLLEFLTQRP